MTKSTLPAAVLAAVCLPGLALAALPAVGDRLGTSPDEVKAALAAAGCPVEEIGAEDGYVEAKCRSAEGKVWEIYLDPATGVVAAVKADD